jgi:hypothetical protein
VDEYFQPLPPGLQEAIRQASKAAAQAIQPVFQQQAVVAGQAMNKLTPLLTSYSKMAQQVAAVSAASKFNWATQLSALQVPMDQYLRQISLMTEVAPTLPNIDYQTIAALRTILDSNVADSNTVTAVDIPAEEAEAAVAPWLITVIVGLALVCLGDEQARMALLNGLRTARVLLDASPIIERNPEVAGAVTLFDLCGLVGLLVALLRRFQR